MDPINVNLNIYQTLAAATAVYYVGVLLRIKVPFLRRYCLPAPVIGGIIFAILNAILYTNGIWTYKQDTIMQNVCMMLFFTSIGYTASISLIRKGGSLVAKMAVLTTLLILCQNGIGIALAHVFDLSRSWASRRAPSRWSAATAPQVPLDRSSKASASTMRRRLPLPPPRLASSQVACSAADG